LIALSSFFTRKRLLLFQVVFFLLWLCVHKGEVCSWWEIMPSL
jgi:hypothetical protein